MIIFLNWWKTRDRAVDLLKSNSTELFFLLLASAYAFAILFKNRIDLFDFAALLAIFGAYTRHMFANTIAGSIVL